MPKIIKLNKKINGMPIERYIAACLLTDSEFINNEYYFREDELTITIKNILDNIEEFQKENEKDE